jgi:predicted nucleic acid-binding Zn ribbon protein
MSRRVKSKRLKRMGELLPRFLKKMGLSERLTQQKAVLLWKRAVGTDIKKHTTANKIEQGILFVSVSNPAWMNELVFLKSEIIKKLNEMIGQKAVTDIKFHLK